MLQEQVQPASGPLDMMIRPEDVGEMDGSCEGEEHAMIGIRLRGLYSAVREEGMPSESGVFWSEGSEGSADRFWYLFGYFLKRFQQCWRALNL